MRSSSLVTLGVVLGAGIFIGNQFNSFTGSRGIATVNSDESPRSSEVSGVAHGGSAYSKAPSTNTPVENTVNEKIAHANSLLDQMRETDLERGLATALGTDSIGLQLARALMAGRHQEVVGSVEVTQAFLSQLKSDPRSGIDMVREGLRRIPEKGYETDRMTLLQTASILPGMESDAREMALREVVSNTTVLPGNVGVPMDSNANPLLQGASVDGGNDRAAIHASLVATAYNVFIDLTQDSEEAFSGTVQGIVSQPDPALRRRFVDKFISKFPDRQESLQRELATRQVDPYQMIPAPGTAPELQVAQAMSPGGPDAHPNAMLDQPQYEGAGMDPGQAGGMMQFPVSGDLLPANPDPAQ